MKYQEAINYLFEQLPMYQRTGLAAYKSNLDNTHALDQLFKHPHRSFKSIHVAGTNGKGSVAHALASVLQKNGYKTGLYTSPHLDDYRERIRINGEKIPKQKVCDFLGYFLEKNRELGLQPSFFELSVAMAFQYFKEEKVDFAVVEVGLGGRLDSTNIIHPLLSVITNISLDHTNLLGNTEELIAGEKAGIIKNEVPVVIGEFQEKTARIFQQKAEKQKAPIVFADRQFRLKQEGSGFAFYDGANRFPGIFETDLKGGYQKKNLLTVLVAIELLKKLGVSLNDDPIRAGLKSIGVNTGLKGRWQKIGNAPTIIADNGHNVAGIRVAMEAIEEEQYKKLHIVFGTVNDKDLAPILALLPKHATYYFARPNVMRGLNANNLLEEAVKYNLNGKIFPSVREAFEKAQKSAARDDLIFVGGSTFVVAEIL